jgi:hypothetical protein
MAERLRLARFHFQSVAHGIALLHLRHGDAALRAKAAQRN